MTAYYVHVEQYWTYKVDADTPEDAAQIVIDDGPRGECTGYQIDAVTLTDEPCDDDLRAPVACRGRCGKMLPASRSDECSPCLLARLEARSAAS